MDKIAKTKLLRKEISRHDRLYYVLNKPEISDQQYDALYKELIDLETTNPSLVTPDSPTQRVGDSLDGFKSCKHPIKMLSLDNTYDEEELRAFDKRVQKALGHPTPYCVELKIDGAAVSLWYENGILAKALTRGDGEKGDDVTANVKTMRGVPLRLNVDSPPAFMEVRGEVYMSRSVFQALNKERQATGKDMFANPRNAASGSLKLLDPKKVAKRKLSFFCHTPGKVDGISQIESQSEFIRMVSEWGVPVVRSKKCQTMNDVWKVIQAVADRRSKLDYETDGMVVKVNDFSRQETMGNTSRAPRFAIAYKYPAERAETLVENIDVQVGKTGALTPVARLKPVYLAGSTISNASLHNQDEIDRMDVRIGDFVLVEKAGEIIPQVVGVLKQKRKAILNRFQIPDRCPACNSKAVREKGEVVMRCLNKQCPAKAKALIQYWASKHCMDIDSLGESLVEKLVEKGLISTPADLYSLTKSNLLSLDGVKDKSADKLLANIEASKKGELSRLIAALNIPMVGRRLGVTLAEEFGSLNGIASASLENLERIEKVGTSKASAIFSWFADKDNKAYVNQLYLTGINTKNESKKINNPFFSGKTFVLTGTLNNSRSLVEDMIRERGGKTSGSVSKKTDYVLAGEKAGSKLEKAKTLGVKVITEEEFDKAIKTGE